MDNTALIIGILTIYWHGILMAFAVALAVIISLVSCARFKKNCKNDLINCIFLSVPFAFVCARLLYYSCNYDEFITIPDFFNFSRGGYAHYGAFIGVLLAAAVLKKRRKEFRAGAVLDCIALGSAPAVMIGRLAACLSGDNIGNNVKTRFLQFYPFSYYSQQKEDWLIATFNFEAVFELIIFIVLCVIFVRNSNETKGMKGRHGDIALLYLLMHGCSQGLFDSSWMHIDALLIPGNSFVRIQQILGAVSFFAVTLIFSIRSHKMNGYSLYQVLAPLASLAAVGITLAMELNRISDYNLIRNYTLIFLSMLGAAVNGIFIYQTTLTSHDIAE